MTKNLLTLLAAMVIVPALAADAPTAQPVSTPTSPAAPAPNTEALVEQFRNDLQATEADVLAKTLTLTGDQAAKFWPLFEQFQKEQKVIIDEQFKATQKYAEHFATLTDADAQTYVSALLERDIKVQQLRIKWLKTFQSAIPAKTAARAIQIDRRLGLVTQVKLSSQIPLVR